MDADITLLTGGIDKPYAFGLSMALIANGVRLDFIGGTEVDSPEMHASPWFRFLNLYGNPRQSTPLLGKVLRVAGFYRRLFLYTATAKPRLFHILWNNKLVLFDRTFLMLYYRLLGKKVVLTAHNVNAGKRDANDSFLNRLTLKVQYRLVNHIFVHTDLMKQQLFEEFGIRGDAVTVIPFGINNSVPNSDLTSVEAKERLGIPAGSKTILFFGSLQPYKGLDSLVAAFHQIAKNPEYRLIIAGEPRKESQEYVRNILQRIEEDPSRDQVIQRIEYVPDADTELYFKAADVLALPYVNIFQSGVLFLSYYFGLPIIATDVGSFREHILEGQTGFLSRPCDSADLASKIDLYFKSTLFAELDRRRQEIRHHAQTRYSWDTVGATTCNVYRNLLGCIAMERRVKAEQERVVRGPAK